MTQYRQALALFRYGLIAEFIQLPAGSRGLYARLREKANADYTIPGSTRTRVAPETLAPLAQGLPARRLRCAAAQGARRSWPLTRAAPGVGRCAGEPQGRAAHAVHPAVDPRAARIGRRARVACRCRPRPCTGCSAAPGSCTNTPPEPSAQDRRRFAFAQAGELWMSDVMHGPSVAVPGRGRRKSLSHRLPRRRHARGALLRLRPVREHASLPAGVQAGAHASRHPAPSVRRQRRQLPLATPRAGVCQARRRADPRPPLPAAGQGQDGALVSHRARAAAQPPAARPIPTAWTASIAACGPGSRANITRPRIAASRIRPRWIAGP